MVMQGSAFFSKTTGGSDCWWPFVVFDLRDVETWGSNVSNIVGSNVAQKKDIIYIWLEVLIQQKIYWVVADCHPKDMPISYVRNHQPNMFYPTWNQIMLTSGGQETQGTNMRSWPLINGVATRRIMMWQTRESFYLVLCSNWTVNGWTRPSSPLSFSGVWFSHWKKARCHKPNTRCRRCPTAPMFHLSCWQGTSMPRKNTEARWGSVVPSCEEQDMWTNHALMPNETSETIQMWKQHLFSI